MITQTSGKILEKINPEEKMDPALGETVLALVILILVFAAFCFAWLKLIELVARQLVKWNAEADPGEEED